MNKIYAIITLAVLLLYSCSKEENDESRIPWAPVWLKINLRGTDANLNTPGESKMFTQPTHAREMFGYSGLLIVSGLIMNDDGTPNLQAYDLCCPYEADQQNRIIPKKDGKAECGKCGSVYNFYEGGYAESGPAKSKEWRLKWYRVRAELPYNGVFYVEN